MITIGKHDYPTIEEIRDDAEARHKKDGYPGVNVIPYEHGILETQYRWLLQEAETALTVGKCKENDAQSLQAALSNTERGKTDE